MKTIAKLIYILTIILAGMTLVSSCSKNSAMNKKGKARAAAAATDAAALAGNGSLDAIRDGQYVNLTWHINPSVGKFTRINIIRSSTGLLDIRRKMAELNPDATSYKDCLPDENAQWYWVQLVVAGDKNQFIGPARVGPDKAGSDHYIHPEDAYQVSIMRTDDIATLKWNFPDDEYKAIQIVRNKRPVTQPFKGGSTEVVTSLEGKSQYKNTLKDPNAEYWYWFRITTKSGTVIYKGPIKAEYTKPAGR